ncbi:hypothetical protein B0H67DRAFT_5753 [Lasiosphaeris hirsuta]|uniref:Uncharacterized protein n=1 Tax=Lasiosphaeris hirsuta TaxID=260670 RepID=A0AA40B8T9_9PEZI|nr:hypothetical protein B0H67DRAFT_5753 [Lasiosphaeris hirsuta]
MLPTVPLGVPRIMCKCYVQSKCDEYNRSPSSSMPLHPYAQGNQRRACSLHEVKNNPGNNATEISGQISLAASMQKK